MEILELAGIWRQRNRTSNTRVSSCLFTSHTKEDELSENKTWAQLFKASIAKQAR